MLENPIPENLGTTPDPLENPEDCLQSVLKLPSMPIVYLYHYNQKTRNKAIIAYYKALHT